MAGEGGTAPLGLIGLGEAGLAIASGLHQENGINVIGYDAYPTPELAERSAAAGVELADSLEDLARRVDVVICLTSASSALAVAEQMAPHLGARHLYTDWNSASPSLKQAVGQVIDAAGAAFADGAVMAAVPPQRHRVPVLLSGAGAVSLATTLSSLGMRVEVLGLQPGQASAVKMLRSLLVKGLEALLLECAVGAQAFGVTERVLDSMNGTLPTEDWRRLAEYLMTRTLAHGQRRAEELRQSAGTLESVGVEPLMARAGAQRLQWLADRDLGVPKDEMGYLEILETLQQSKDRR